MKLFLLVMFFGGAAMAAEAQSYESQVESFRKGMEESLKKNWLMITGLTWLREGENTIGSDATAAVVLPDSTPKNLGKIIKTGGKTEIEFTDIKGVKVGGKVAKAKKRYELKADKTKDRTLVEVAGVEFWMIDRPNGIGVRVKDPQAETLKNFKGLTWFPTQKSYVIKGKWKELTPPKTLRMPDILGNTTDEVMNGSVVFTMNGKEQELFPSRSGEVLFFVFKDPTSGKATYAPGRFLEAKLEKDGSVELDFNTAYNPPCAVTKFATCPLPPAENILKIAIEAGEKAPAGH